MKLPIMLDFDRIGREVPVSEGKKERFNGSEVTGQIRPQRLKSAFVEALLHVLTS